MAGKSVHYRKGHAMMTMNASTTWFVSQGPVVSKAADAVLSPILAIPTTPEKTVVAALSTYVGWMRAIVGAVVTAWEIFNVEQETVIGIVNLIAAQLLTTLEVILTFFS